MTDIMRAQLRQIIRAKTAHIVVLALIVTFFCMLFLSVESSDTNTTTASELLAQTLPFPGCFSVFAIGILISIVGGTDFSDKTVNYELMAGRSRAAVFFGRTVPLLVVAPLAAFAVYSVPYVLCSILYGWGDALTTGEILTRFLLLLLPALRLSAFILLALFVTKKQFAPIICVFVLSVFSFAVIQDSSSLMLLQVLRREHWFLGITNIAGLADVASWRSYDLNLHEYYTYYPALPAPEILYTVICSLGMTAVYLLLGYHYFHRDDME